MRISQELRDRVVELDRRYRSTWDAHAIAHVLGMSPTTAAKILREERGPRPKRAKEPHTRRTRFIGRDVMWSSDFVRLGWGWLLIKTIDEMSGFRLGWELCRSETAEAAVAHARSIIARMGRAPLVWKYDHGSAFTSGAFQKLLACHKIVAYPTHPRAPWTNGRVERDHQEILNWLIALEGKDVTRELLEREIDEGMWMLNYVKPRAVLGFKKSAEVYFKALGTGEIPREQFLGKVLEYEVQIGMMGTERTWRKAIRMAMQYWEVYEEWTALPWWDKDVNRTRSENVSF
jgi:transposase InsO family protein